MTAKYRLELVHPDGGTTTVDETAEEKGRAELRARQVYLFGLVVTWTGLPALTSPDETTARAFRAFQAFEAAAADLERRPALEIEGDSDE